MNSFIKLVSKLFRKRKRNLDLRKIASLKAFKCFSVCHDLRDAEFKMCWHNKELIIPYQRRVDKLQRIGERYERFWKTGK